MASWANDCPRLGAARHTEAANLRSIGDAQPQLSLPVVAPAIRPLGGSDAAAMVSTHRDSAEGESSQDGNRSQAVGLGAVPHAAGEVVTPAVRLVRRGHPAGMRAWCNLGEAETAAHRRRSEALGLGAVTQTPAFV